MGRSRKGDEEKWGEGGEQRGGGGGRRGGRNESPPVELYWLTKRQGQNRRV